MDVDAYAVRLVELARLHVELAELPGNPTAGYHRDVAASIMRSAKCVHDVATPLGAWRKRQVLAEQDGERLRRASLPEYVALAHEFGRGPTPVPDLTRETSPGGEDTAPGGTPTPALGAGDCEFNVYSIRKGGL